MDNFQVKIFELVESGQLKRGDLANLDIRHDEWCRRLNGTGECNCDPEISVYKSETVDLTLLLRNINSLQAKNCIQKQK